MGIPKWTPEHEDALRKYCALKTLSFRQIADQLTEDFSVSFSRNACIGKAGRLDIRTGPKEVRVAKPRQRIVKTGYASFALGAPINNAETKLRCVEIVPLNLSLTELEANSCRYPYGDGPFTYCGHPKREGFSYCAPHFHLTHEKPKPRQDKYLAGLAA